MNEQTKRDTIIQEYKKKQIQLIKDSIKDGAKILGVKLSEQDIEYIYKYNSGEIPFDEILNETEWNNYYSDYEYMIKVSIENLGKSEYFLNLTK